MALLNLWAKVQASVEALDASGDKGEVVFGTWSHDETFASTASGCMKAKQL